MGLKTVLKQSDTLTGLVRDSRKILRISKLVPRSRAIKNYLRSHPIKKLQLGAGPTSLPGWLSTDIAPQSGQVLYLDATKLFPFEDQTFDYVYSEHLIEHLSWPEGFSMLRECRRVLIPGGRIRIATPDLEVIVRLYDRDGDPLKEKYTRWITNRFLDGIDVYKVPFVINNAFRNWGHQFLYDGELIEMALQRSGFVGVKRCLFGKSDDEHLKEIESHGKNITDQDMALFETMVFEGRRPA